MMICGSMKLKVMLLEWYILKSGRFGRFISMVICHRNRSSMRKSYHMSHMYTTFFCRFLSKVYCYAKKTGSSPEDNSNWQCYSNGKWSPSNGVVTCSSSARSKFDKKSLFKQQLSHVQLWKMKISKYAVLLWLWKCLVKNGHLHWRGTTGATNATNGSGTSTQH